MCAAILLCVSAFAGCGLKDRIDPNDPQKLQIYVWNAGYGHTWAEKILEAFKEEAWVKEKYPELKTSFEKDEVSTRGFDLVNTSKRINKFEVIFSSGLDSAMVPNGPVADLTEAVYDSDVPGEPGVKFKDKLMTSYLTSSAYNDGISTEKKYYQLSWASGMTGMIYNETKLKALGESVPNTTTELTDIMERIKKLNGANPAYPYSTSMATYGASAYAHYLRYIWWAQYQTAEEYINFYNGIDSSKSARSPEVLNQKGLRYSLDVLEKILHKNNGYTWLNPVTGRESYLITQDNIQLGTNAIFMANGDWVESELAELRAGTKNPDTIKLMRTPIISNIIEQLPSKSIKDDQTLSKVVAAIDKGESGYTGVEPDDFEAVRAARQVVYSIGPNHHGVIPEYASGKAVAIDFLRYMATDKANEIYIRETGGASLPFQYDLKSKNITLFNQITPLHQERINYFNELDVNILPYQSSFPLSRLGGFGVVASGEIMTEFTNGNAPGENYGSVAERLIARERGYWMDNSNANWRMALNQAGL